MVWMPTGGPVAEDVREDLRRRLRLGSSPYARREAEVVVRLAEVAEPLDVVDEDEDRRLVLGRRRACRRAISAASSVYIAPNSRQVTFFTGCGQDVGELAELAVQGRVDRAAVEEVEAARLRAGRAGAARRC